MKKLFAFAILLIISTPPFALAQTSAESTIVGQCINGTNSVTERPCTTINSSSGSGGTQNGTVAQGRGQNLGYTPLEPIAGVTTDSNGGQISFTQLIGNIYEVAIIIGALFSVLMLTVSGIRYMVSDIAGEKQKAKDRIRACLIGLVLIAASYLILRTINPQLVTFNLNPGSATINGSTGQVSNSSTQSNTNSASQYRDKQSCEDPANGGNVWMNDSGTCIPPISRGISSYAKDFWNYVSGNSSNSNTTGGGSGF